MLVDMNVWNGSRLVWLCLLSAPVFMELYIEFLNKFLSFTLQCQFHEIDPYVNRPFSLSVP